MLILRYNRIQQEIIKDALNAVSYPSWSWIYRTCKNAIVLLQTQFPQHEIISLTIPPPRRKVAIVKVIVRPLLLVHILAVQAPLLEPLQQMRRRHRGERCLGPAHGDLQRHGRVDGGGRDGRQRREGFRIVGLRVGEERGLLPRVQGEGWERLRELGLGAGERWRAREARRGDLVDGRALVGALLADAPGLGLVDLADATDVVDAPAVDVHGVRVQSVLRARWPAQHEGFGGESLPGPAFGLLLLMGLW